MSIFLQSIRHKVTKGQVSNTFLLKTFVITSVTTFVSAFSFLKSSEHQRSSLKLLQYTGISSPQHNNGPQRITIPNNFISFHSLQSSRRLSAMMVPNTTFCDNAGESKVQQSPKNHVHSSGGEPKTKFDETTNSGQDDITYYYERMKDPPRNLVDGHAIFGALLKPGYIERYDTYRRVPLVEDGSVIFDKSVAKDTTATATTSENQEVCVADVRVGESLNGHAGIVHGGIISLILDDTLGWGYEALSLSSREENAGGKEDDYSLVVTANLTVNYRKPLRAGSNFVVRVRHEKTEGRKVYFTARIESYDGKTLYAEASSLFLKVKKEQISTTMHRESKE
jgi:acyl-coenzyme A thioesterase PaaI-like protein